MMNFMDDDDLINTREVEADTQIRLARIEANRISELKKIKGEDPVYEYDLGRLTPLADLLLGAAVLMICFLIGFLLKSIGLTVNHIGPAAFIIAICYIIGFSLRSLIEFNK